MKILLVHLQINEQSRAVYKRIAACAPESMEVEPFALLCPRLRWDDLDICWRTGEPGLMSVYESLSEAAAGCDVLLHYNGWSLHPEFIRQLPTFNVYCFFDDPESSWKQSRHVAPMFDAVLYGNIASRAQYASWGCQRIAHTPIFFDPDSVPSLEEADSILDSSRDVDIVLCCGQTPWRKRRLAGLMDAFPSARVHGRGWEAGFISNEGMLDLYRQSKLGWNIHNSTGPINQRMFMLPAWGIMQICDNKTGLGQLFELGREAIGFDTIPEAIELTRHFLEHDEERRHIARAAHERFHRDYHPQRIWAGIERQLRVWIDDQEVKPSPVSLKLRTNRNAMHTLQRVAASWLIKQRNSFIKSYQRIRYDQALTDLDESIYLGLPRDYHQGRSTRSAKLRRLERMTGHEDNPYHLEAMSWAITCLIGSAKTIITSGPHAAVFANLASIDPARTVDIIETTASVEAESSATHELYVCTEVVFDPETFTAFLLTAARIAARGIFCLRGKYAGDSADCDMVYDILCRHSDHISMSFMPDPFVPWLEPLKGSAKVRPLIVECQFHRKEA